MSCITHDFNACRRVLWSLFLIVCVGVTACNAPQDKASPHTQAPTFDPRRLSEEVRTLSSEAFEGRGPGTPGEIKTIEHISARLQADGLQPGGDLKDGKRLWTQAVPLLRAEITGTPTVSLNIGGKSQALTQGQQIALRPALNGDTHVTVKDAPLVFAGYGVKAPGRNWDDFKGLNVKGKILVVLINDPDFETGQGDFGGKAATYYGRWTYKYEEAARLGAAGLLIVHEDAPAAYGWETVKNSYTHDLYDMVRDDPKSAHVPLEGWIQRDLAVALFRQAGLDFDAVKKQAQTRDFKPIDLRANLSADYTVDAKVITTHNIVGRLEGSQRPNETVIYSAHWDHLGVGEPDAKGDRIYNGALDNATGTAALLELGRAFAQAKQKPARSLVFLYTTAEEKNLLGAEYYASKPLYPLAQTVAVINVDSLQPFGPTRDFSVLGDAKSDLLDQLSALAAKWDVRYSPDIMPEAGFFFRGDQFPFAQRGVPAFWFNSGSDRIDGGVAATKAWSSAYFRDSYHQPSDEWHADWPFTGMARDLQIIYTLGSDLANATTWPNWAPDSEYRAARDASADERK
ncbi:M28 family peptidase [Sphingomonas cavernae]|uniref:M28 family peptidase n=1 Tax=Sphingomonas cavernae TaxID=2320861 RepID=A0A418WS96_9SPHN|nr:M28 family peptidase [Sphingomonas cavernae]